MTHEFTKTVTFGDCDHAGISFYPNMFTWMDVAFHDLLRKFGGHAKLCEMLGAKGLGLAHAEADFRYPLTDGDQLDVSLEIVEWGQRTLTIRYEGRVGSRLAFEGREVRCLFKAGDKGIFTAPMEDLRNILEGKAHG